MERRPPPPGRRADERRLGSAGDMGGAVGVVGAGDVGGAVGVIGAIGVVGTGDMGGAVGVVGTVGVVGAGDVGGAVGACGAAYDAPRTRIAAHAGARIIPSVVPASGVAMRVRLLLPPVVFAVMLAGCAARIERGDAAPMAPQDESDRVGSSPSNRVEVAGLPDWLRIRLADYDAQTDRAAPRAVYAVSWAGATAYYVQAGCCDQLDPLIDAHGVLICHPTGGYTGRGDDKCTNKLPPVADRREVWRHR